MDHNERKIPLKLIRLTRACVMESRASVRTDAITSEPFKIERIFRKDDALSPLFFNIVLEKVVRTIENIRKGCEIEWKAQNLRISR